MLQGKSFSRLRESLRGKERNNVRSNVTLEIETNIEAPDYLNQYNVNMERSWEICSLQN